MGVHLVIDGYNLIRSSPSLSRRERTGLDQGREALLERLAAYKRIKRWPITVVFDAARGPRLRETADQHGGVRVVFSSEGRTADEVIVRMARQKGPQALVVTSDHDLARRVESAGATTVGSDEFESRLEQVFFMDFASGPSEEEDRVGEIAPRKKGPARRKPKSERRRQSKIKKI
jgi:hypothetical protein